MATNNSINNTVSVGNFTVPSGNLEVAGEFVQTVGGFNAGNDATDSGINIGTGASSGRPVAIGNLVGNTSVNISVGTSGGNARFGVYVPTGDTRALEIISDGTVLLPKQPGFLYYYSTTASNVTGDYTEYTFKPDAGQNVGAGGYNNSTGVFTAPVAGRYFFCLNINYGEISVGHTDLAVYVHVNNSIYYYLTEVNPFAVQFNGSFYQNLSFYAFLSAADTVAFQTNVGNSTRTVDVQGGTYYSSLYGQLLA